MIVKLLLCLASAAAGYLIGSVSTGVLVSRWYGDVDIRKHGSGNVGMTNVMRTLGWLPSFLTFAGDALKGALATWLGGLLAGILRRCLNKGVEHAAGRAFAHPSHCLVSAFLAEKSNVLLCHNEHSPRVDLYTQSITNLKSLSRP